MNLTEFWKRVEKDGCWTWTGATARGKGRVWFEGALWTPPELAWMSNRGSLPPGQSPIPACGSHLCCRPDHMTLVLRTSQPRQLHSGQPGGELHPRSKLTAEQVQDIRSRIASGDTQRAVGALFGISQSHVSRVARGARWGALGGSVKVPVRRPYAKLSEADIPVIWNRVAKGESLADVASDYHVSTTSVSRIWHGKSWTHVPRTDAGGNKSRRTRVWED